MMKQLKLLFVFLLLVAGSTGSAWAGGDWHHGGHGGTHVSVGVGVGVPVWGWGWGGWYPPYAYYPPYYPYPAVVAAPAPTVTYVEQAPGAVAEAQPQSNSWYYCHQPEGYYPYVKECPGGWQAVPAQPPAPPQH